MHNTRPHPCTQPHKQGEWGGQHKYPRGPPWGSKWLTHWVCHSECKLCLCSHLVPTCTSVFLPQVNCTSVPQTYLPPHLPSPHHSYEFLPLPALATHTLHLHPPLLQLSALSSHAIICWRQNHIMNTTHFMYTFAHYRKHICGLNDWGCGGWAYFQDLIAEIHPRHPQLVMM